MDEMVKYLRPLRERFAGDENVRAQTIVLHPCDPTHSTGLNAPVPSPFPSASYTIFSREKYLATSGDRLSSTYPQVVVDSTHRGSGG